MTNLGAASESRGSLGYLVYASVVSALGGFLFGYDTVVINGAVAQVSDQFALSAALQGTFVGSALFGCMIGAALAGFISDLAGRQKTLSVAALLMLVSAIGCGMAWSAPSLIFFRWIGGVGVGFASMVCPLYISEISPPRLRGRLVTLFQFAITIGIFVAFLANAGWQSLSEEGGGAEGGFYHWIVVSEVWRAMFTAEAIPAIAFFVLCLTIPETPRFLAKIGRDQKAMDILVHIGGRAVAIATLAVWATDWVYNQAFPVVTEDFMFQRVAQSTGIGIVFFFFAAVLVLQLLFVWKVMPETKNKTLEEIEREWINA